MAMDLFSDIGHVQTTQIFSDGTSRVATESGRGFLKRPRKIVSIIDTLVRLML